MPKDGYAPHGACFLIPASRLECNARRQHGGEALRLPRGLRRPSRKIGNPDILADQKEYNRLAKEYADQGALAKKAQEYVSAMEDLEAAKEMLGDADMKEFAQDEIAQIEAKLPQLEEDLRVHADPGRPCRREGHHRRDPRGGRRRRGGDIRRRPVQDVRKGSLAIWAGRPRRSTCRRPKAGGYKEDPGSR